jgi:hypothetical protein
LEQRLEQIWQRHCGFVVAGHHSRRIWFVFPFLFFCFGDLLESFFLWIGIVWRPLRLVLLVRAVRVIRVIGKFDRFWAIIATFQRLLPLMFTFFGVLFVCVPLALLFLSHLSTAADLLLRLWTVWNCFVEWRYQ